MPPEDLPVENPLNSEELPPLVYEQLRRLAAGTMLRGEGLVNRPAAS